VCVVKVSPANHAELYHAHHTTHPLEGLRNYLVGESTENGHKILSFPVTCDGTQPTGVSLRDKKGGLQLGWHMRAVTVFRRAMRMTAFTTAIPSGRMRRSHRQIPDETMAGVGTDTHVHLASWDRTCAMTVKKWLSMTLQLPANRGKSPGRTLKGQIKTWGKKRNSVMAGWPISGPTAYYARTFIH
jgi:hypothetical protein